MAGKIFISYRRDDARADARSIYQSLQRTFGSKSLFMDVDSIEKGRDFREVLERHLAQCDVMLVVIGRRWWEIGETRLADGNDFVRLEIETALKRNIAVIPVLVEGASMPSAEKFPENLKLLLYRQSATVTHERFASDMAALEHDIARILGKPRSSRPTALAAAASLLIAGGVAVYIYTGGRNPFSAASPESPPAAIAATTATTSPPAPTGITTIPAKKPSPAPPQTAAAVPAYEIEAVSGITGIRIDSSHVQTDASNPKFAVDACADICTRTTSCIAFELGVVHSRCTTYRSVERRPTLGGYISGVRK